jgi:hypothetical protein
VNVPVWLDLLQSGNKELLAAFEYGTWSTPKGFYPPSQIKLQASLDYTNDFPEFHQSLFMVEGLNLFESIFGFRSKTWIPNNFIVSSSLFGLAKNLEIKGMQGMVYHVEPKGNNNTGKNTYQRRRFGISADGLVHVVRNCSFEPTQSGLNELEVNRCLREINSAFLLRKPAVISSHRLNFIGVHNKRNRESNLLLLKKLLTEITKRWPDALFLDSSQLVDKYLAL